MEEIKEEFDGKFYWCSVDETTDRNGRCMANLIVGVLDPEKNGRCMANLIVGVLDPFLS